VTERPAGRARTVFVGSGSFGVPALERLLAAGPAAPVELAGIVTVPPRPAGRAGELRATPIQHTAAAAGFHPVLTPSRLRAPEAVESVLALEPDLLVLADYGGIVPPALLGLPFGALNLHPSLLPRHRGAAPIPATILAGDRETGVTIIRMDEGIDSGPIIAVERVRLDGSETAPALEGRLAAVAAALLERTLAPWLRGELHPVPQPVAGVTVTTLLRREDGRLDAGAPVVDLERQVRALQPWPGTFIETEVGRVAVHAARIAQLEPGDEPGRLVRHGETFAVVASDGRLVVEGAQPAGGRAMSGAELVRGRPALVGARVTGGTSRPS
jgi:methionyl-tRNA formyltransferase